MTIQSALVASIALCACALASCAGPSRDPSVAFAAPASALRIRAVELEAVAAAPELSVAQQETVEAPPKAELSILDTFRVRASDRAPAQLPERSLTMRLSSFGSWFGGESWRYAPYITETAWGFGLWVSF